MWPFKKAAGEIEFKHTPNGAVLTHFSSPIEEYEIPAEYEGQPVTAISAGAFKSKRLRAVYAGKNISSVGKKAFAGCGGNLSVILPEKAERADGALLGCKCVYFEEEGGLTLASYAGHEERIVLDSVCLKRKVIALSERLFYMFAYLKEITLPESLVSIGKECFSGCSDLESIRFPMTLKTIGASAFSKSGLRALSFPYSLERIGEYAFLGCDELEKISFSSGRTALAAGVFAKCALTDVKLPEEITEIQSELFRENKRLEKISLPKTVEAVWDYAFADSGLTSVSLPENTEVIGEGAFSGMPNLTSVSFSNRLREIGGGAFAYSGKLTEIASPHHPRFRLSDGLLIDTETHTLLAALPQTQKGHVSLPEGIEIVGDFAFSGLSGISSVTLPASVKKIGASAFRELGILDSFELMGGLPEIGDSSFFGTNADNLSAEEEILDELEAFFDN